MEKFSYFALAVLIGCIGNIGEVFVDDRDVLWSSFDSLRHLHLSALRNHDPVNEHYDCFAFARRGFPLQQVLQHVIDSLGVQDVESRELQCQFRYDVNVLVLKRGYMMKS